MTNQTRWRKSSRSGSAEGGNCVEVASTHEAIRDSKNPTGPVLKVPTGALLAAVKDGRIS